MGKRVKRRLTLCSDRNGDEKIDPSTPIEPSSNCIDIDSDHDHDLQSELSASMDEEDDTLLKIPKRKRDLTVVSSDDELDEGKSMPKKRAFKIVEEDEEDDDEEDDDDDNLPINRIFNKYKRKYQSEHEDDEDDEDDVDDNIPISQLKMNRDHGSRRSVRLQQRTVSDQLSDDSDSLNQPRKRLVKRVKKKKKYVEDEEESEDDENSASDDDNLTDFIVNDTDVEVEVEVEELEDEFSSEEHDEDVSDDNLDIEEIMSQIGRRKEQNLQWDLASMLSDFGKDPELCMRGVCAVYRRQIAKQKLYYEDGIYNTGIGFNKFDNPKGSMLGDFLTDGNPDGGVVKTVEDLREFDPEGAEDCYKLAARYATQLLEIYQNEEDDFFP